MSAAYLPNVATTLNNLGVLYLDMQRLAEAEEAYQESLKIRQQLAEDNPAAYLPDLARTLNNMRLLCKLTGKEDEARRLAEELERVNAEIEAWKKQHSKPAGGGGS